jgi:hypothetical protein
MIFAVSLRLLLLISGEQDHIVPWAIANASDKQQKDNGGVTQITQIADITESRADDRQWMARGRRHRARVHQSGSSRCTGIGPPQPRRWGERRRVVAPRQVPPSLRVPPRAPQIPIARFVVGSL